MDNFDWNNFLESSNSVPVPEELFLHVESSLFNGIKQGMLVEVCHKHNPDVYWIAEINMVCGHLLRIKFVGADNDFWCDISSTKVHTIGWCGKFEELVDAPDDVNKKYGDNIIDIMKTALLKGASIPEDALINNGLSPIDRIKAGMKVEVQNILDPFRYWIATVCDNVGGRLQLRYDGCDDDLEKFWIFYTSSRLCSFGFVTNKGSPWQFKYPAKVNKFSCKNKLSAQLRLCAEESIKDPTPGDLFQPTLQSDVHNFISGMKLEALDPRDMKSVRPATVVKVYNSFHFLVAIDDHLNDFEDTKMAWLCDLVHPYIYPIGWAQKNSMPFTEPSIWKSGTFDWDEYLTMTSSVPAPEYCFGTKDQTLEAFQVNMKLEVVHPQTEEIHAGSIDSIVEHMICIELLSNGEKVWYSPSSDQLFPVGWCDSNNHELCTPILKTNKKTVPKVVEVTPKKEVITKCVEEWCDRIFFNYKCYAGPMISRNKLSQLPKHVGPGPLSLVLKEVLNKMISASYKPAKLLKDWETAGPAADGMRLEMLRAKLKTNTYHAYVPIATTATQMPMFCRDVCVKLQACPFLFGPIEFTEQCPERCQQVDKSKFHNNVGERRGRPKGSTSKGWANGKKKKKKGPQMSAEVKEQQVVQENENKEGAESGNESEISPGSTPQQSECGTRPNSPESVSGYRRQHQKRNRDRRHNFPRTGIKTRGAKLPNFAQQIKEGHWSKKDVETIYRNTCLPKKSSRDSDTENESSNSTNSQEEKNISDVSDEEEPELKKLKFISSHDPQPSDNKNFERNLRPRTSNTDSSMSWTKSQVKLTSNPLKWSVDDVHDYLSSTNCKVVADKLKEEEIDGAAFIMLNLPMIESFLHMRTEFALQLCKHITMIRWYYIVNFEDAGEDR